MSESTRKIPSRVGLIPTFRTVTQLFGVIAAATRKYVADEIQENAIIIGADTVVVLNNTILTKPIDHDDAIHTLKILSGKEHQVVTGICIINKYENKTKIKAVTTKVTFEHLSDKMINYYIDNFEYYNFYKVN